MDSIKSYPGAVQLTVDMGPKAFLADLYEAAWIKRDLKSLFTPLNIVRDPNAPAYEIPRKPMKLSWNNMIPEPSAIYVRDEYHEMLRDIVKYAVKGEMRPGQRSELDVDSASDKAIPFHNYIADVPNSPPDAKGAIAIGTPGIGKSLFLYYALALCLHARRPAILQNAPGTMFVMNNEGIFRVPFPGSGYDFLDYLSPGTWFFVDSGPDLPAPRQAYPMWRTHCKGFILQAASPRSEHVDWTDKAMKVLPFWMSPWTLGELIVARDCQTWEGARPSERDLATFVELFGGCARDVFRFSTDRAAFKEKYFHKKIWTLHDLKRLIYLACGHRLDDDAVHKRLMMYPAPYGRTVLSVRIATRYLFEEILKDLQQEDYQAASHLYGLFIRSPLLRDNAVFLLERALLHAFSRGGQWPVTDLRGTLNSENNVHWNFDENAPTLYLRLGYQNRPFEISNDVTNASSGVYTSPVLHRYSITESSKLTLEDGLYVPSSPNQASFDAFAYDANSKTAAAFQIVVSERNRIKAVGLDWLKSRGVEKVVLVAVTPPLQEAHMDSVDVYMPVSETSYICTAYHLPVSDVEV